MSAFALSPLSSFALAVARGLAIPDKSIAPRFLYDAVGEQLFSALTMLPEYGITGTESRLLTRHAFSLLELTGQDSLEADIGCSRSRVDHTPSHPSPKLLPALVDASEEWLAEVARLVSERTNSSPMVFKLSGGVIGNLDCSRRLTFLRRLRRSIKPHDFLLLSLDLVKTIDQMVGAYADGAGIAAAFNKNLLARVNRDLGGHFDVRQFRHDVRWNAFLRRVELCLVAEQDQEVYVSSLLHRFQFVRGETIQTAIAYKFSELELEELAHRAGFKAMKTWTDLEWPLALTLWSTGH